ncbi:MAG: branched-chain amino acid ABC transporter permease [Nanoarchaeota archaeon]|jgi:branched-chain amino acid transport system permease protein|nr:branched-chain amino acid ABC transporter permease [Nanoarchaeota archaeon]
MIANYFIHILILVGIYSILSVSLNLALGYTGLLNLGHVAFFGVGAYVSALLNMVGVPFIISFLAAGVVAGAFGLFLIYVSKKLKGDYLALATLGFAFIVYSLLLNLKFTRGPLGIPGIPKPEIFGIVISSNLSYLILVLVIGVLTFLFFNKVVKSSFGKMLGALRDDELNLRVLGKNTTKLKYYSMGISAFFAGIAGSLFAHYITYIDPSSFYMSELILIVTIVIIGGLASIEGSLIGAFIVILIPEVLRFFALPSSILGPMRQIFYALVLIGVLWWRPKGILGKVDLQ